MPMPMSRLRRTLVIFVLLCSGVAPGPGAEVGLNFTAQVTWPLPGNPTYGINFPTGTMLSGHFVYESNNPGTSISTETCGDCAAYHQKHINGLRVEFPGLTLEADEYIIELKNDIYTYPAGDADVLSISFPDQGHGPSPKLSRPLLINGSPVSNGLFALELIAPTSTFTSSQLPATLVPSAFVPSASFGFFGDGAPAAGTFDLLFVPQSFAAYPHSTSDHDLDGDVDGRDLLIWQREVANSASDGDADSNLLVDDNDLAMWQTEYGSPSSKLAAVAVPEPSAYALLICICLIGTCRR